MINLTLGNIGKAPLSDDDISKLEPLQLKFGQGCKILEIKLIYQKKKSNNVRFTINREENSIDISFYYLSYGHFFELAIYTSSLKLEQLEILGELKEGISISSYDEIDLKKRNIFPFQPFVIMAGIFCIIAMTYNYIGKLSLSRYLLIGLGVSLVVIIINAVIEIKSAVTKDIFSNRN
jgi:hypothetical protein